MYSAYKLNKQGDNIQPWCTPFPIWNQSVVPCPVVTIASLPAYRFLKRQVKWSGIPISSEFSTVCCDPHSQSFGIVNKAEVDVFLELSCFFDDPVDVGNLISGCSAFSKSILNVWKFTVHILLKPGLENFEHYLTSVWDECNCAIIWTKGPDHVLKIDFKYWRKSEKIFMYLFKNIWTLKSWEICMQVRKQQLELDMEQQTGFK